MVRDYYKHLDGLYGPPPTGSLEGINPELLDGLSLSPEDSTTEGSIFVREIVQQVADYWRATGAEPEIGARHRWIFQLYVQGRSLSEIAQDGRIHLCKSAVDKIITETVAYLKEILSGGGAAQRGAEPPSRTGGGVERGRPARGVRRPAALVPEGPRVSSVGKRGGDVAKGKKSRSEPRPRGPRPRPLRLTQRQRAALEQIVRRASDAPQLVLRAQIVLALTEGAGYRAVAQRLGINRDTVLIWRQRWLAAAAGLTAAETQAADKALLALVQEVLDDKPRGGRPAICTPKQMGQIVAVAGEEPETCGRPILHWTSAQLAGEVIQRNIVKQISPRSVRRFLEDWPSSAGTDRADEAGEAIGIPEGAAPNADSAAQIPCDQRPPAGRVGRPDARGKELCGPRIKHPIQTPSWRGACAGAETSHRSKRAGRASRI